MAEFISRARRRLSGSGSALAKMATTNPIKKHFQGDRNTDLSELVANNGIALTDAVVSDMSRTNQDEDEIHGIEQRIIDMLRATTRARVHIDDTVVDRFNGFTDFVLSDDSCHENHAAAIRSYLKAHFDPNIYEVFEKDTLVKQTVPGFPVPHSLLLKTLVIRAHAVLVTYTGLRFLWRKSYTLLQFAAICLLVYSESYMLNYQFRYA